MLLPLTLLALLPASLSLPSQIPLIASEPPARPHGRFIHLTDIHPDPHYLAYSRPSSMCHNSHFGKKEPRRAGYWGTPLSDCDIPMRLVNLTLEWMEREWADKVDFVIWTGDSARHDNDRNMPRTDAEIYATNRYVAQRMIDIFTSRGIPVVPSIGNNDVWPHNVMYPGPSAITAEYASIWAPFVPLSSYASLQHGTYFSLPLVRPPTSLSTTTSTPKLAALSLNTLFWYDSNKVVPGCVRDPEPDPGAEELDWMEEELERYRREGWKVWLVGHVPPSQKNYHPECYRRYGELALRYQDTIVGHLYGHMNMDHFSWISASEISSSSTPESNTTLRIQREFSHEDLRREYHDLPKARKTDLDDYAIINVAPSVVATYLPGVRVWTYNTTGIFEDVIPPPPPLNEVEDAKATCKGRQCLNSRPRHAGAESPSRTNMLWTPLGFAQFYMPGLEEADEHNEPTWELEYVTYLREVLLPPGNDTVGPVPAHLLPPELLGPEADPFDDEDDDDEEDEDPEDDAPKKKKKKKKKHRKQKDLKRHPIPYSMPDLTISSWLDLARRLAKHKKLWSRFCRNFYVGTGAEDA